MTYKKFNEIMCSAAILLLMSSPLFAADEGLLGWLYSGNKKTPSGETNSPPLGTYCREGTAWVPERAVCEGTAEINSCRTGRSKGVHLDPKTNLCVY